MKTAARLAAALALGLALPAWAQEGADKARLDDFAVPQERADLRIEQLDDAAASLPAGEQLGSDRALAVPGPPQTGRAPMAQLSRPGETAPSQQLSDRAESRELAAGSVSSPNDSRPRASAPLVGSDSCDPQLDTEQLERCLRILELRAAEFSAPEAPRLSAEQALLAERGEDDERLASRSSTLRLRLAAGDPNAEFASNQELASIYLDRARTEPSPGAAQEPGETADASLAEVLQSLQIEVAGPASQ